MQHDGTARRRATDATPDPAAGGSAVSVPILVGTLLAAKLAVVGVVVWASTEVAWPLIVVTTWPWLVAAAVISQGTLLFRWRLVRQRARRARLLQAEWMAEPAPGADWDRPGLAGVRAPRPD